MECSFCYYTAPRLGGLLESFIELCFDQSSKFRKAIMIRYLQVIRDSKNWSRRALFHSSKQLDQYFEMFVLLSRLLALAEYWSILESFTEHSLDQSSKFKKTHAFLWKATMIWYLQVMRDASFEIRDRSSEIRVPRREINRNPRFEERDSRSETRDPRFEVRDPRTEVRDSGFEIRYLRFEMRDVSFDSTF